MSKDTDWNWIKEIAEDDNYYPDEPDTQDIEQELCRAVMEFKSEIKRIYEVVGQLTKNQDRIVKNL